ncbi:MAG: homocysteine S-methyltransferase family protein [Butyricicoccus sp.]
MKLTERLGKEWIFFDGGMGTILQEHGLKAGELPETWNLSHPDEIIALNRSYFEAGCDVVNTNTFGANALKYPDNLQEIVQAAAHEKPASQAGQRMPARLTSPPRCSPMGDLPERGRAVRRNHSHRCGGGRRPRAHRNHERQLRGQGGCAGCQGKLRPACARHADFR